MKQRIHINQLGYIYNMDKKAVYVGNYDSFSVVNAKTNRVLYSGTLSKPVQDINSDENVKIADFSSFNVEGTFYIKIGMKKSAQFKIAHNPYENLDVIMLKALYYNRSNFAFDGSDDTYSESFHSTTCVMIDNPDKEIEISCGWHDADNYANNTVSACYTVACLLYAYKLFSDIFDNMKAEEYNDKKLPCILEEAKNGIDFLLKMQDRNGSVYHKVSCLDEYDISDAGAVDAQKYVFPASHQATADFTACMALASSVFEKFDKGYSEKIRNCAVNAWVWLMNNPKPAKYIKPKKCHINNCNEVSDNNMDDDIFWASCEMYSVLRDDFFMDKIKSLYKKVDLAGFTINNIAGFGTLSYLLSADNRDKDIMNSINMCYRISADNIDSLAKANPYNCAKNENSYVFCSNLNTVRDIIVLFMANRLLGNEEYIATAVEQLNYLLGKNAADVSFITGVGTAFVKQPHHRQSVLSFPQKVVKGMLVCGPNAERKDEYTKWNLPKGTPPAKCYEDSIMSDSTNKPSEYLNAAAILALGFVNSFCDRN